jgi:stearoyl-CoA desaturase (Delta-9 desaturase)
MSPNEADLESKPITTAKVAPAYTGKISWNAIVVFVVLHLACLTAFLTEINVFVVILCGASYLVQMIGITIGYHRFFAHRSFKTSRPFQFLLACLGCSASQSGPSWWVARHRQHHRASDTAEDLHSPVTHGFWWSHSGWILSSDSDGTDADSVKDLIRYPEIRWLDRYFWVPPLVLAGVCFLLGGWSGLIWGFLISTVLTHHATFTVNSVCHMWGRQRYGTGDASRNNFWVALITLGEGWHNNHHHYQSSARQGVRWWEIDVSYYLIRLLACFRCVWHVRTPPRGKSIARSTAPAQLEQS